MIQDDVKMNIKSRAFRPALWLAVVSASAFVGAAPRDGSAATTASSGFATSEPAADRTPHEIVVDMAAGQKEINDLLGQQNSSLKSAADRDAVAPKLLPLIQRLRADMNELAAAVPQLADEIAGSQMQLLALGSAVGDRRADQEIQAMTASADPSKAADGQAHQLMARFYVTDLSSKAQTALIDDVEKVDRAHADNILLTRMTIEMGEEERAPDLKNRLLNIAADQMNNPAAASLKEQLVAKAEATAHDALVANKPLTLTGTLMDGQSFSTASLKGKVVLVDFWATWCGPCKAELPRVKTIYQQYHSQGLEVVGVSNDYDVEALKSFVLGAEMPWPQLFDANAAARQEWNSITVDQKIDGIPVMYLIDRKGILRTVNARSNMETLIPQLLAEPQ